MHIRFWPTLHTRLRIHTRTYAYKDTHETACLCTDTAHAHHTYMHTHTRTHHVHQQPAQRPAAQHEVQHQRRPQAVATRTGGLNCNQISIPSIGVLLNPPSAGLVVLQTTYRSVIKLFLCRPSRPLEVTCIPFVIVAHIQHHVFLGLCLCRHFSPLLGRNRCRTRLCVCVCEFVSIACMCVSMSMIACVFLHLCEYESGGSRADRYINFQYFVSVRTNNTVLHSKPHPTQMTTAVHKMKRKQESRKQKTQGIPCFHVAFLFNQCKSSAYKNIHTLIPPPHTHTHTHTYTTHPDW